METLLDEYSDISEENLYLSIGKITQWGVTNDNRIPSIDSVKDDTDFWRGMIAAKRINRDDVSLVVRRIDWNPGKVFDAYRDDVDLFDDLKPADFYALVDDQRVYICIDNNNNSQSLYPPTHTDSLVRKLADGYRWKFLYEITETKRKFLTKSDARAIGYMPVEYIEYLQPNDERRLQWLVQQNAVNGKIDFAYADDAAKIYWVSTDDCIFPSGTNLVAITVPAGATYIDISSPDLVPTAEKYKDMIFSVDSGAGQGQRRVIKSYTWNSIGGYGRINVDELTTGLSSSEAGSNVSLFSIQPRVLVSGDGFGTSTVNPYITTADLALKFGSTADSAATNVCNTYEARLISGIEIINGGKDYSFANLDVPKGVTALSYTPPTYRKIANLIHAVMPPPGGHGANPVKELGSNAYMIVAEYDREESGKVDTDNDFRQFGILRNPLLQSKQFRLKFYQSGITGSFSVGGTAGGGNTGTGAIGTILEWCKGKDGVSGTSELVLNNIIGPTFAMGATFAPGFKIFDVREITRAGQEGRHLLNLRLASVGSDFADDGSDYSKNYYAHGVGNTVLNVGKSYSSGQICGWSPDESGKSGILSLEFPKGRFDLNETVLQMTPKFEVVGNGFSGPGRITSISTELENVPSVYDLTTTVRVSGTNFDEDSFLADSQVYFSTGLTIANGYIIDWVPSTGGTYGDIRLAGLQGNVAVGQNVDYVVIGPSGNTSTTNAQITTISHKGELKFRSGDILYIQNMNPVLRDLEQREEIKLVIEL